jgi:hypothetical protein
MIFEPFCNPGPDIDPCRFAPVDINSFTVGCMFVILRIFDGMKGSTFPAKDCED